MSFWTRSGRIEARDGEEVLLNQWNEVIFKLAPWSASVQNKDCLRGSSPRPRFPWPGALFPQEADK